MLHASSVCRTAIVLVGMLAVLNAAFLNGDPC
jgi:hypothetical protein